MAFQPDRVPDFAVALTVCAATAYGDLHIELRFLTRTAPSRCARRGGRIPGIDVPVGQHDPALCHVATTMRCDRLRISKHTFISSSVFEHVQPLPVAHAVAVAALVEVSIGQHGPAFAVALAVCAATAYVDLNTRTTQSSEVF